MRKWRIRLSYRAGDMIHSVAVEHEDLVAGERQVRRELAALTGDVKPVLLRIVAMLPAASEAPV